MNYSFVEFVFVAICSVMLYASIKGRTISFKLSMISVWLVVCLTLFHFVTKGLGWWNVLIMPCVTFIIAHVVLELYMKIPGNSYLKMSSPLGTILETLKFIGRNSPNGGYLYNHFKPMLLNATTEYAHGVNDFMNELDWKARGMTEIYHTEFANATGMYYIEFANRVSAQSPIEFSFYSTNKQGITSVKLTQGQALYIYMCNKITDGAVKLRKMGILEEDVQALKEKLDPRAVEMADWIQGELLPLLHNTYNVVYERLFGVPMTAIECYFPIRLDTKACDVDVWTSAGSILSSISEGRVDKRRFNTYPIDLKTDAFEVVLFHLNELEIWHAFAEVMNEFDMLLSYTFKIKMEKNYPARWKLYDGLKSSLMDYVEQCKISFISRFLNQLNSTKRK